MSEGGGNRRLSAVLMADIADYTRLVEHDTDGTVSAWKVARTDVIDPTVAAFSGRIVKLTGDGFLAEFSAVQDAVACAIAMQKALSDGPLSFRMGISLGDIVDDGQDIHGEGVNIAARIEAFAPTGGICVSGGVHDQVRNRLDVDFKDLGDIPVKNVSQPVRVYAVLGIGMVEHMVMPGAVRKRVSPAIAGAIIIVLVAVGGGYWLLQEQTVPATAVAPATQQDKAPSIAILPFVNLSDDPARAYFADGMTEDITTDLSRVKGLAVTAPSATRRYIGKDLDPVGIGSALNVAHILEGSVRQAGDQIRITAKLIDSATGSQLWAERFDRSNADVFAIQDEISKRVVEHLSKALGGKSFSRTQRGYIPDVAAYDLYIQARAKRIPPTPPNLAAALKLAERSIDLDPKFAGGYSAAAFVHILYFGNNPNGPDAAKAELDEALRLSRRAVKLDPSFGPGWGTLAEALFRSRDFTGALDAINRAIELAPADSLMLATLGRFLGHTGSPAEGAEQVKQAMRMSPDSLPMLYYLGQTYRAAGALGDAIGAITEHRERLAGRVLPAPTSQLVAALQQAGRQEEAGAEAQKLLKAAPYFTIEVATRAHPFQSEKDERTFADALRFAGIPD